MRLDGGLFKIFFNNKNQNYRILDSNICVHNQHKILLDFVPRRPRGISDEKFGESM